MKTIKLEILTRLFFIILSAGLIGYILFSNIAPFGMSTILSTHDSKDSIKLGPRDRVVEDTFEGQPVFKQTSDIIYFNTKMLYPYDHAKVKITFQNSNMDQPLYLGFQDQEQWHYTSQLVDIPFLDNLSTQGWKILPGFPSLFQKGPLYTSWSQFLSDPPKDKVVGVYNFDQNIFRQTYLPNYSPTQQNTVIDTPLRGKVVFYTYVQNEPFHLKLWEQDLNTYPDPDAVDIKVYKDSDIVYETQINDDGITDASGKVLPPQEVDIQNPGPGLPEPGVYKVIINGGADNVITRIETNMHKIVFDSPLYPVSNHEVYPKIVDETKSNTLYSDALMLSTITNHTPSTGDIQIGQKNLELSVKQEQTTHLDDSVTKIILPKSDIVLQGIMGYFAFTKDQMFDPTTVKLLPITNVQGVQLADYIIADYTPSTPEGKFMTKELDFDLSSAYINNGNLSWIIRAPGIESSGNKMLIKKIEVTFDKKPLIKRI